MTASPRLLSECIEITPQFRRAVCLDKDYRNTCTAEEYIITPTARQVLGRIAEGLRDQSARRAWTVTGPYGVGKSALAAFLTNLLCKSLPGHESARSHLAAADRGLSEEIDRGIRHARGLLPVLITARRVPAAVCLLEGLREAACLLPPPCAEAFRAAVEAASRGHRLGGAIDSRDVVRLLEELDRNAVSAGYSGVLAMVDELGKLFEYAARAPETGDVYVLQEVAEYASRSGEAPVLFLGLLHQAFEDYGRHLDISTRKEWRKVHGRFEDVPFLEPEEQVIRMIGKAIRWTAEPLRQDLSKQIRELAERCFENGVCPRTMQKDEFETICQKVYPIHPVTLVSLPFLFRRFAQNERSLFSYLNSIDPGGFQHFLRTHEHDGYPRYLRTTELFDYFTLNCSSGLLHHPDSKRWLEALDALERMKNPTDEQAKVVKTVGILSALDKFSHLTASRETISLCLADTRSMPPELEEAVASLSKASVLSYRKYRQAYRIWEGSDVDIPERISEAERKVKDAFALAQGLEKYVEKRPFVAKRHSTETGALRYFWVTYVDDPSRLLSKRDLPGGSAGEVVVCLPSSDADHRAFLEHAGSPNRAGAPGSPPDNTVFAVLKGTGILFEALSELAALRWVQEHTPELAADRVARRELSSRIAEAEQYVRSQVRALLDPREDSAGEGCRWFWMGEECKVGSRFEVSRLLSRVCDAVYNQTPRILNELIVRRTLSSAAAAARRTLVEKMLSHGSEENLGIQGYPPERSIYESSLKATGIHRQNAGGEWCFCEPTEKSLLPAWQFMREAVLGAGGQPQSVHEIFGRLAAPPYGILDGLHPILLCAFLQAHRGETSLYREGTLLVEPGIADFEVLMRRPELFSVAGIEFSGCRRVVLQRMAELLNSDPSVMGVARALFKEVRKLPEFAWRTGRVSRETARLREACETARVPERLLFVEIPHALGLRGLDTGDTSAEEVQQFMAALRTSLQEWSGIAKRTVEEAERILLEACGFEGSKEGWRQLRECALALGPWVAGQDGDPQLALFLRRVAECPCDDEGAISALALVSGRPPATWSDADIDRFPGAASALGQRVKHARRQVELRKRLALNLDALDPEQRQAAKNLAEQLLQSAMNQAPREIARAALLMMITEWMDSQEG